ncbi:MAG: cytochrome c oxidase subunit II [Chloroflexi bacterium]|nr:MAG: cytochrome c oxidase subunit II [Chloroflexota bacterium]
MSMSGENHERQRRVLIASANPLFARGLQKLVAQRLENRNVEVRLASNMDEVTATLETWHPDLVIVDYDDAGKPGKIQREAFLSHFIAGDQPMQVMLVSLRASGEVVVYDRRTLTPAQAEDWLDLPWSTSSQESQESLPAAVPVVSDTRSSLRSGSMKHYVIAGGLTLIFTLILGYFLTAVGLMPVAASAQAVPVDQMISLQVWMIAFLFSLITVFIGYSVVVFRRKRAGRSGAPAAMSKGSNSLEVAWTLIPLAIVIFLSFIGARDLGQIRRAAPDALEVKVTAFQWGWAYEYPDTGVTSTTLYLPVNRQAHLLMTSRDVIHSFWVPEFRVKQDILPGQNLVKELRITPTLIGDYKVRCAEMCGGAHAYMEGPVKVVSQADFDAWVNEQTQAASANPADRGSALARNNGCVSCHSLDGAKGVGPTWKGLAGSQVTLADGSTVTADDAYLYDAIVDPNKQIHAGFPPGLMPQTYETQFNEQQIMDMVEFIKTLK